MSSVGGADSLYPRVNSKNETTLLQAELLDEDSLTPWYQKWWVWTAASAVVAGTVATAVLLSESTTTVRPTSK